MAATTAIPEPAVTGSIKPVGSARLISLDVFRGWTMFWIVGGSALMTGLAALGHNRVIDEVTYQLGHSTWQGLRFIDLIWPSFMLMTGMSLPFSYAKQSLTHTHAQIFWKVLRRATVLVLLGSLRESMSHNRFYLVELSSALQPIGIAYFAAFLLVRRSWRFQAVVAMGILVGYALVLALAPGYGIPAGSYDVKKNLVAAVDVAVLGRTHPDGWGTVLSTIPTLSTTILGMLLGELLRSDRSQKVKLLVMAAVGIACVGLGFALDPVVPIIMKLWTTSYGLASAGLACLMFLGFYFICDVCQWRRWAFPLIVIGSNALAIYMGQGLFPFGKIVTIYTAGIVGAIGSGGPLFRAVAVLAFEWLILYWMYRKKIFLTA